VKEIALQDRFILQQKILDRYVKGESEQSIARALGLKRVEVKEHLDEWRQVAVNNPAIMDRAKEALAAMDKHYNMIIEGLWESVEEAGDDYKAKGALYKNLADIEAKRQEVLQKAGILNDNEISDQLAEAEEQFEKIKTILREVSSKCPRCRQEIAERMKELSGKEDPLVVNAEEAEYTIVEEHTHGV